MAKDEIRVSLQAAIFDMDGLLLNTEPLWTKSMAKITRDLGIGIKPKFFKSTTGLRISEVTRFWKEHFPWPEKLHTDAVANTIVDDITQTASAESLVMPGVFKCLKGLKSQGIKIGLATSSPMKMIKALIPLFQLDTFFDTLISADSVTEGKPHPAVYLACAKALNIRPWQCVAFEDSVNGMIAAKAARMKVVVVPEAKHRYDRRFGLADITLDSLNDFDNNVWNQLSE